MATTQYIGARYVPLFYTASDNSNNWEAGVQYEPLTIVTYLNQSYTSKIPVPASVGDPASNPTYWIMTGAYNAQINQLSQEVDDLTDRMDLIDKKRYILVGDSLGHGGSNIGWIDNFINDLGLTSDDYYEDAASGAGFAAATTFLSVITGITPNVDDPLTITDIIVMGGANERGQTTSAIVNAIEGFIAYVHTEFPNARIHIGDVFYSGEPNYIGVYTRQIYEAYAKGCVGYEYVNFVDNLWLCLHNFSLLQADNIHPTLVGYQELTKAIIAGLFGSYHFSYYENITPVAAGTFTVQQSYFRAEIKDDVFTFASGGASVFSATGAALYFGNDVTVCDLPSNFFKGGSLSQSPFYWTMDALITNNGGTQTWCPVYCYVYNGKLHVINYNNLASSSGWNACTNLRLLPFSITLPTIAV